MQQYLKKDFQQIKPYSIYRHHRNMVIDQHYSFKLSGRFNCFYLFNLKFICLLSSFKEHYFILLMQSSTLFSKRSY